MNDEAHTEARIDTPTQTPAEKQPRPAWLRVVGLLATDVGVGVLLAAMIIATLLFSSGASKFVYIDF